MIWVALALAQTTYPTAGEVANYDTSGDWRDCQNHSSIAGTAGFENARAANATNALAYGSSAYMQQTVLPMLKSARQRAEDGAWHGGGGYRYQMMAGAAHVPTLELGYPFGGCPSDLRISNRPLDMGSINVGFAASNGTFGLFYSSSVAYGYTPASDPRERFLFGMTGLVYGGVGAALAPLAGGDQQFGEGASAVFTDFVVGGMVDTTGLHGRLGWVGSQGVYADLEADIPVFVSAVIDEPTLANLLSGGLRRFATKGGRTSLYARNQPFRPLPAVAPGGEAFVEDPNGGLNLFSGHVAQEDIGKVFDVQLAYTIRPTAQLQEAQIGLHAPKGEDDASAAEAWLIRGGLVQLPDLWFYGVEGGIRPTFRAEFGIAFEDEAGHPTGTVRYLVMMNDPAQLVLFPYAYDALTMGVTANGSF